MTSPAPYTAWMPKPPTPTQLPSELQQVQALRAAGHAGLACKTLCEVSVRGQKLGVEAFQLGSQDPTAPAIAFIGGVHGLERIGAEVVLNFLHSLLSRMRWDRSLQDSLRQISLWFVPVVNPGGLLLGTRANPQGVDLMRNAPVEAIEPVPYLIGGQRISANLPWFRGLAQQGMEAESTALCELIEEQFSSRRFSMVVDCHSGFGLQDRIWFPYAHTTRPIEQLPELYALHQIYAQSHIHHPYVFEPQSLQYLTHGDLWDYLYQRLTAGGSNIFLPLTLEMGSWLWVRKNPRQLFSAQGLFNPLLAHRQQRVMRRHLSLLDFLIRATVSAGQWLPEASQRESLRAEAVAHWYPARA